MLQQKFFAPSQKELTIETAELHCNEHTVHLAESCCLQCTMHMYQWRQLASCRAFFRHILMNMSVETDRELVTRRCGRQILLNISVLQTDPVKYVCTNREMVNCVLNRHCYRDLWSQRCLAVWQIGSSKYICSSLCNFLHKYTKCLSPNKSYIIKTVFW